tara:strand:+ start:843 stop:1568 length:726 start_codon:yes stop_codon:yes gene_type:complete
VKKLAKNKRNATEMISWAVRYERRAIWSINANPKSSVYGESLKRFEGTEYRRWDPNRSKLGAGLMRTKYEKSALLPEKGSTVLYLGAGHGTSISHLYDHLCGQNNQHGGRIVAVDLASRCLRDLTHLAKTRPGLVPVLGDARKHSAWGVLVPRRVDWLFQDVAQSGQVDIFISACKRFLNIEGIGLLSLKAASERWTGEDEQFLFRSVEEKLSENGFEIKESIELTGYEDNHVLFVARRIE